VRQIIKDYSVLTELKTVNTVPMGGSQSPKAMIFHILEDNSQPVDVLDIGFGAGELGRLLRSTDEAAHWNVDGVDGWETNCLNKELFEDRIYRNVWHGFAQELPSEFMSKYKIICLLDVIEHLNLETAKWLFRTLLTNMGEDSVLFVSTPLWFYPQGQVQEGDLEEHLIGVPASSMFALIPRLYSINHPLVGGFVYGKESLRYVEFFQPTADKNFSYEMGLSILKCFNVPWESGSIYKIST